MRTPEWTEIGNTSGLDPLGMMRPSEQIYQPLLSGISTVTNRLRYYSFLTWFLYHYAADYSDTDISVFRKMLRHAEALYALLGYVDEVDAGLSGSNWASRFYSSHDMSGIIDFGESARDLEKGFLQNQGGALAAIYGAQMVEMGLVEWPESHKILIPTKPGGLKVAKAFEESLGAQKVKFVQAIKTGVIDSKDLKRLKNLRPSNISSGSSEWHELKNALFGQEDFKSNSSVERRDSLKRMLMNVQATKKWPEAEDLRWDWYKSNVGSEAPDNWLAYHINDILLFGYEALLKYALQVMQTSHDQTISWQELSAKFVSCLDHPEASFLETHKLDGLEFYQVLQIAERGGEEAALSDEDIKVAIILIQKSLNWAAQNKSFVTETFQHSGNFRSVKTEMNLVQNLNVADQANVLTAILENSILKRHLWVAGRKFRSDSKYTFLFEPFEGELRYKKNYSVWMGYPRISPALRFLSDLGLIDDDKGLTLEGVEVLSSL